MLFVGDSLFFFDLKESGDFDLFFEVLFFGFISCLVVMYCRWSLCRFSIFCFISISYGSALGLLEYVLTCFSSLACLCAPEKLTVCLPLLLGAGFSFRFDFMTL